tara:strand:- start:142 stop:633 length:492 start_codon:yes stop_codon:yes gene_type:complete
VHIIIKNKKLCIDSYKVKCAIGKRGIGTKKREGDLITPKGKFKINCILYRRDRIGNLISKLKKIVIKKNMGWCNDPVSKDYNKLIKFPFPFSAEKLFKKDNTYDIILVLSYNTNPVKPNKGSAIFLHIARKDFRSTEGCVAIKKKELKFISSFVNKKTLVKII